jgi:hypothetical protein
MLFSGIECSVVQGIERRLWKWAATVSGTEISGEGSTRDEAIEKAKKAIERAIGKQRVKQDSDGERR